MVLKKRLIFFFVRPKKLNLILFKAINSQTSLYIPSLVWAAHRFLTSCKVAYHAMPLRSSCVVAANCNTSHIRDVHD